VWGVGESGVSKLFMFALAKTGYDLLVSVKQNDYTGTCTGNTGV